MTPLAPSTEIKLRSDADQAASVFPALMVEAQRVAHTIIVGLHGRRRSGPGETFWQHRPYAFGDPVNSIDWRQSARVSNRLFVRQNEWEAAAAVWIWRDGSTSLDYASREEYSTKRWRADVLATAVAILLANAGERVGILNGEAQLFQGRTAPMRFLESLLLGSTNTTEKSPPKANIAAGSKVLFISDFFTEPEKIETIAAHYAASGINGGLLQIIDPAEEDFPFKGRTEFEDIDGGERILFGEVNAVAKAYREKFSAHRAYFTDLAQRLGWSMLTHRTDKPATSVLLSLYAAFSDYRANSQ